MAYCRPVSPMVATRMTDADPMTMPRAVNANRTLLARKLSSASEIISLSTMICLALASVRANDELCVLAAAMVDYQLIRGLIAAKQFVAAQTHLPAYRLRWVHNAAGLIRAFKQNRTYCGTHHRRNPESAGFSKRTASSIQRWRTHRCIGMLWIFHSKRDPG